jgi:hypothetical protein
VGDWDIYLTSEVGAWLDMLQTTNAKTADLVDDAIYALSRSGPALRRPLVDTITGSKIKNLKGTAPRLQRHQRDPDLFRLRPLAISDTPGRRGQVRKVEPVVRHGNPARRATV